MKYAQCKECDSMLKIDWINPTWRPDGHWVIWCDECEGGVELGTWYGNEDEKPTTTLDDYGIAS